MSHAYIRQGDVGPGCKWTLTKLRAQFRKMGIDDGKLWQRIWNVVVLTLLGIVPEVPQTRNCFELLGFDVMIDDKLKPWLIEVNFSPALSVDDSVPDQLVKPALIRDIVKLCAFRDDDSYRHLPRPVTDTAPPWAGPKRMGSRRGSKDSVSTIAALTKAKIRNETPSLRKQRLVISPKGKSKTSTDTVEKKKVQLSCVAHF